MATDDSPIVLLHDLGAGSSSWAGLLARSALAPRMIAVDLPGHGAGPAPASVTLQGWAAEIADRASDHGLAPVHWVGVGLGGVLAAVLAAGRAECSRSLLVTAFSPKPTAQERNAWVSRGHLVATSGVRSVVPALLERWFTAGALFADSAEVVRARAELLRTDPLALRVGCGLLAGRDLTAMLTAISCPTTVLELSDPTSHADALQQRMILGTAARIRVSGVYHGLAAERPELFDAVLQRHLAAATAPICQPTA